MAYLACIAVPFGEDRQLVPRLQGDLRAQLVKRQALEQRVSRGGGAVDQDGAVAFGQEEIEKNFALRRQQRGIEALAGRQLLDVVGDQALQEPARLGP